MTSLAAYCVPWFASAALVVLLVSTNIAVTCMDYADEWPLLDPHLSGPDQDILNEVGHLTLVQGRDTYGAVLCLGSLASQGGSIAMHPPAGQEVCIDVLESP